MIERSEPITTKINQIIRDRVNTGTYRLGSRLPSELALAIEFGVSRSTLRNAVNSLVTDGVIIRKHGNGSYINPHAFQFNTQLQNLWSFPQLIQESGRTPDIQVYQVGSRASHQSWNKVPWNWILPSRYLFSRGFSWRMVSRLFILRISFLRPYLRHPIRILILN